MLCTMVPYKYAYTIRKACEKNIPKMRQVSYCIVKPVGKVPLFLLGINMVKVTFTLPESKISLEAAFVPLANPSFGLILLKRLIVGK